MSELFVVIAGQIWSPDEIRRIETAKLHLGGGPCGGTLKLKICMKDPQETRLLDLIGSDRIQQRELGNQYLKEICKAMNEVIRDPYY